ncbi:MAG: hypothetical protein KAG53_09415 [Endozoicomonadaceae bacterium]|nr:hypothetical protein [Endozoicomonadaceae bacterium]
MPRYSEEHKVAVLGKRLPPNNQSIPQRKKEYQSPPSTIGATTLNNEKLLCLAVENKPKTGTT